MRPNQQKPFAAQQVQRNPNLDHQENNNPFFSGMDPSKKVKVEQYNNQEEHNPNDAQNGRFLAEYNSRNVRFCNEDYSFLSNQLLYRFSQIETAMGVKYQFKKKCASQYPLFKVLRGITKKFMLNELEIIFFLHIIEETKWNYKEPLISDFVQYFNFDFLNIIHEVQDQNEYHKLILYLISCAYAIKGYLTENQEVYYINIHISQYVSLERFQKYMDNWRQHFMHGSFRIMPRAINKFFIKLVKSQRDQQKPQLEDYNMLVDQIISISPPYSSEKAQKIEQQKAEAPIPAQQSSFMMQPTQPLLKTQQSIMSNFGMMDRANFLQGSSIFGPTQLSRLPSTYDPNNNYYLQPYTDHDELGHSPKNNDNNKNKPATIKQEIHKDDKNQIKNEEQIDDPPEIPMLRHQSVSQFMS